MSFREYMRWDGSVAVAAGSLLFGLGLVAGHQAVVDAALGGALLVLGTGIYMTVRHGARFREPGTWFVAQVNLAPRTSRAPRSRVGVLVRLVADAAAMIGVVVGLSYLTGFWLTYMDLGVWSLATGAIKLGPAAAAAARRGLHDPARYRVARLPLRGPVELSEATP